MADHNHINLIHHYGRESTCRFFLPEGILSCTDFTSVTVHDPFIRSDEGKPILFHTSIDAYRK